MKKHIKIFLLMLPVLILLCQPLSSGAEEKPDTANVQVSSRLLLNYVCGADSVILTATLGITRGDMGYGLELAVVDFTASNGNETVTLGKIKTDQEGIAVCKYPLAGLASDKDGMIIYSARFPGNDKYPEAGASFTAKPAKIKLFFSIEDSIRILKVTATQKDSKGTEIAIPKETIHVYIPRLFSLLPIGEIELDENGTGTMEFPKEIVGDTLGNLVVLARIEEHDVFGFAQGQNMINWGVHKQYYQAEVPSRELWTPIAPLWMIITLIIMLAGVWAHYMYAVYELYMIKKLSKKDKQPY